jgi:hypothetical protein
VLQAKYAKGGNAKCAKGFECKVFKGREHKGRKGFGNHKGSKRTWKPWYKGRKGFFLVCCYNNIAAITFKTFYFSLFNFLTFAKCKQRFTPMEL